MALVHCPLSKLIHEKLIPGNTYVCNNIGVLIYGLNTA